MWPPPLLSDRPRHEQVISALVAPVVFGSIAGILIGVSSAAYLVISLLAFVGGILAGYDHVGAAAGAKRGILGGTLYGAFTLIAHEIDGSELKTDLPHPGIILVVAVGILGALLGALGGWLRGRTLQPAPSG